MNAFFPTEASLLMLAAAVLLAASVSVIGLQRHAASGVSPWSQSPLPSTSG
jgi:hypothetical protein